MHRYNYVDITRNTVKILIFCVIDIWIVIMTVSARLEK